MGCTFRNMGCPLWNTYCAVECVDCPDLTILPLASQLLKPWRDALQIDSIFSVFARLPSLWTVVAPGPLAGKRLLGTDRDGLTPLPLGSQFLPAKRLQAPGLQAPLLLQETTKPSAAPAAEKRLGLTLAEAIAMAQRNHPRLQEASAVTQRATAAARVARAYTNPSLEIYEGEQYARPVAIPGLPGLLQHYAGYQTIEIPSERHARQRAAQFSVASSRSAEQSVALSVVGDTKHAFYNALRRREEIDHAQENLQLVEDLRRRVEVSVNVGEEGRLELTRAEAELGRARFAVTSAQLEYANAIALLRVTIAGDGDADLDPQGEFEPRISLPPLKQLRDHVLETHPVLAASQSEYSGDPCHIGSRTGSAHPAAGRLRRV